MSVKARRQMQCSTTPGKDAKKFVYNGKGVPGMSLKSLKEADQNR